MARKFRYRTNIDARRNGVRALSPDDQLSGARPDVKMLLLPKGVSYQGTTADIPDFLVTDAMAKRFMEIEPPLFDVVIEDYRPIVVEIERAYVLGLFFSVVATSCVTIERTLNVARMRLHSHHQKIGSLWNKEAINPWQPNINALQKWKYLDESLARELGGIYTEIRCKHLHGGSEGGYEQDALRCARAAYCLLTIFFGFPDDLFPGAKQGRFDCKDESDPRFIEFFKPNIEFIEESGDMETT